MKHPDYIEFMMRKDFVVFLIPKCCSSTLRETLPNYGFKRFVQHIDFNGQKKVAIIRNPLERFLTAFITVERLSASKHKNKNDLMGDFVLTIFTLKEYYQDFHYLPQAQFLNDRKGKRYKDIDYILLEKVNDLAKILGMHLPQLNKRLFENEYSQITDYLNRHWDLTGIINQFYIDDWKLYKELKNGNS